MPNALETRPSSHPVISTLIGSRVKSRPIRRDNKEREDLEYPCHLDGLDQYDCETEEKNKLPYEPPISITGKGKESFPEDDVRYADYEIQNERVEYALRLDPYDVPVQNRLEFLKVVRRPVEYRCSQTKKYREPR